DKVARDCELETRRISTDPIAGARGEHQSEVEPSALASGSTVVASFQVGLIPEGGATAIGWSQSTDAGRTWRSGVLPGWTSAGGGGDASRASDPAVAYDADHATWLVSTLIISDTFTE